MTVFSAGGGRITPRKPDPNENSKQRPRDRYRRCLERSYPNSPLASTARLWTIPHRTRSARSKKSGQTGVTIMTSDQRVGSGERHCRSPNSVFVMIALAMILSACTRQSAEQLAQPPTSTAERIRDSISLGRIIAGWSFKDGSGFLMGVDVVLVPGDEASRVFIFEREERVENLKKEIVVLLQAHFPRNVRWIFLRRAC